LYLTIGGLRLLAALLAGGGFAVLLVTAPHVQPARSAI
jgi:hypothetical protein